MALFHISKISYNELDQKDFPMTIFYLYFYYNLLQMQSMLTKYFDGLLLISYYFLLLIIDEYCYHSKLIALVIIWVFIFLQKVHYFLQFLYLSMLYFEKILVFLFNSFNHFNNLQKFPFSIYLLILLLKVPLNTINFSP